MWRARWVAWRNKLLADQRFQHWAAGFPLTRGAAHGQAQRLFDLVAGFVYSQVLSACVSLALFDKLASGPQSATDLATAMDLPLDSARRLLAAAASLDLVERIGPDRYALGMRGAALRGNPGLCEMIAHHALLYADMADPVALLRRGAGALADFWPYAGADRPGAATPSAVSAYSALMAASQPMLATDIVHAYPLHRHRCLMDVGGGEGAFLERAAASAPELALMLFDLPAVAARAVERLARSGLGHRLRVHGGDFLEDPLPTGADVISLVRVLHDHTDDGALAILKAVRRALPQGGVVLVAEPMSRRLGGDPAADAYFGFYLLAMGRGRARHPSENMALLSAAGFREVRARRARTPMLVQALTARV